ncbi:hypothetical protein DY218_27450 [Streptomyces triticagri]|uniref:Uncharacterized protein n=1 Tax=Streptomyces triticagri TaxID=2293568 RepID=A0A372LY95_9ACTN|nr:hypothetical protein [Streptomyces triticagri]RFU83646.1 hypothetical protein DY218_27450 [Streptomyces triticagri]
MSELVAGLMCLASGAYIWVSVRRMQREVWAVAARQAQRAHDAGDYARALAALNIRDQLRWTILLGHVAAGVLVGCGVVVLL